MVRLSNLYSGAVKSLRWGCSTVVFTTIQNEQPHCPVTKYNAQIGISLQKNMHDMLLEHIFSTLMGISDILKLQYVLTGVSL